MAGQSFEAEAAAQLQAVGAMLGVVVTASDGDEWRLEPHSPRCNSGRGRSNRVGHPTAPGVRRHSPKRDRTWNRC